jgi:hypothetical protein
MCPSDARSCWRLDLRMGGLALLGQRPGGGRRKAQIVDVETSLILYEDEMPYKRVHPLGA